MGGFLYPNSLLVKVIFVSGHKIINQGNWILSWTWSTSVLRGWSLNAVRWQDVASWLVRQSGRAEQLSVLPEGVRHLSRWLAVTPVGGPWRALTVRLNVGADLQQHKCIEQERDTSSSLQFSYITLKARELNETVADDNFRGSWMHDRKGIKIAQ